MSLWTRLKALLVGPVPPADAACEFECHQPECAFGEWAHCHRRLEAAARAAREQLDESTASAGRPVT